ncbi:MAG TPA: CPBP family intramembrane glutamic endopeptidase [Candidatus Sulfotelmatobacter sp.]|nr:CPBP family intramembrane glutamic endopeptidase [Candidatus Sulfotelmatobacter sp.]
MNEEQASAQELPAAPGETVALPPPPALPTGGDVLIAGGIPLATFAAIFLAERALSHGGGKEAAAKALGITFVVVAIVVQNLFLLLCVFLAARRKRRNIRELLGLVPAKWWHVLGAVVLGLLAGPILSWAVELLQVALGYARHTPGAEILAPNGFSWSAFIVMVAAAGVLAPITEEVLFRGIVFGWLRRKISLFPAVLLSAAAFGAAHFQPDPGEAIAHMTYAFGVGLFLAYIYQRAGSLWASIAMHVTINTIAVSYVYLSLREGAQLDQL